MARKLVVHRKLMSKKAMLRAWKKKGINVNVSFRGKDSKEVQSLENFIYAMATNYRGRELGSGTFLATGIKDVSFGFPFPKSGPPMGIVKDILGAKQPLTPSELFDALDAAEAPGALLFYLRMKQMQINSKKVQMMVSVTIKY